MKLFPFCSIFLIGLFVDSSQAQPAPSAPESGKPWAQVQILCGAEPHPVSISMGGQELYQGLKAGSWINDLNIPKREFILRVTKTGSPDSKDFEFFLDQGKTYILYILGDFQALPQVQAKDGKMKPDFRIQAQLLENTKPSGATVNVRAINGLTSRAIELSREGMVVKRVAAGKVETIPNQPPELLMYASDGRGNLDLPMAQKPPAANITLLFYEEGGRMAVKAMLERVEVP